MSSQPVNISLAGDPLEMMELQENYGDFLLRLGRAREPCISVESRGWLWP